MRLETLVLELMADTSALNRDIDKAINKAAQQVKGLENKSVTVKAPLQHLVALNKELDLKQKHILETARLASNNPIVVRVDTREIRSAKQELDGLRQSLRGGSSNKIHIKVEHDYKVDVKESNRDVAHQIRDLGTGLRDIVKAVNSTKQGIVGKTIGGLVGAVTATPMAIAKGALMGFGQDVVKDFSGGFKNELNRALSSVFGSAELMGKYAGAEFIDQVKNLGKGVSDAYESVLEVIAEGQAEEMQASFKKQAEFVSQKEKLEKERLALEKKSFDALWNGTSEAASKVTDAITALDNAIKKLEKDNEGVSDKPLTKEQERFISDPNARRSFVKASARQMNILPVIGEEIKMAFDTPEVETARLADAQKRDLARKKQYEMARQGKRVLIQEKRSESLSLAEQSDAILQRIEKIELDGKPQIETAKANIKKLEEELAKITSSPSYKENLTKIVNPEKDPNKTFYDKELDIRRSLKANQAFIDEGESLFADRRKEAAILKEKSMDLIAETNKLTAEYKAEVIARHNLQKIIKDITGKEVRLDQLPVAVDKTAYLNDIGSNASYNSFSNELYLKKEHLDLLSSVDFATKQNEKKYQTTAHELVHGIDSEFGSEKGIAQMFFGEVSGKRKPISLGDAVSRYSDQGSLNAFLERYRQGMGDDFEQIRLRELNAEHLSRQATSKKFGVESVSPFDYAASVIDQKGSSLSAITDILQQQPKVNVPVKQSIIDSLIPKQTYDENSIITNAAHLLGGEIGGIQKYNESTSKTNKRLGKNQEVQYQTVGIVDDLIKKAALIESLREQLIKKLDILKEESSQSVYDVSDSELQSFAKRTDDLIAGVGDLNRHIQNIQTQALTRIKSYARYTDNATNIEDSLDKAVNLNDFALLKKTKLEIANQIKTVRQDNSLDDITKTVLTGKFKELAGKAKLDSKEVSMPSIGDMISHPMQTFETVADTVKEGIIHIQNAASEFSTELGSTVNELIVGGIENATALIHNIKEHPMEMAGAAGGALLSGANKGVRAIAPAMSATYGAAKGAENVALSLIPYGHVAKKGIQVGAVVAGLPLAASAIPALAPVAGMLGAAHSLGGVAGAGLAAGHLGGVASIPLIGGQVVSLLTTAASGLGGVVAEMGAAALAVNAVSVGTKAVLSHVTEDRTKRVLESQKPLMLQAESVTQKAVTKQFNTFPERARNLGEYLKTLPESQHEIVGKFTPIVASLQEGYAGELPGQKLSQTQLDLKKIKSLKDVAKLSKDSINQITAEVASQYKVAVTALEELNQRVANMSPEDRKGAVTDLRMQLRNRVKNLAKKAEYVGLRTESIKIEKPNIHVPTVDVSSVEMPDLTKLERTAQESAVQVVRGYEKGTESELQPIEITGEKVAKTQQKGYNKAMRIESPSKWAIERMNFIALGLMAGAVKELPKIENMGEMTAEAYKKAFEESKGLPPLPPVPVGYFDKEHQAHLERLKNQPYPTLTKLGELEQKMKSEPEWVMTGNKEADAIMQDAIYKYESALKKAEDNISAIENGVKSPFLKIKDGFETLKSQFPIIDDAIAKFTQFKNLIVSIGVAGAGAIGLFLIGKQLTKIATESVTVYRNFESIFIASKTIANGSQFLEKVRTQVKSLGGDLESAMRQGQQFVTGLQGTNLERSAENLFLNSDQALKSLGLQTQQYDSAILAIKQVASKGKVSLEEISGQLGESVPGALNIAAQAMQTNVQGFIQMVESGNLLSEEFLPKFVARLKAQTAFLKPEIEKSLNASFGRLNANYTDLQLGIGASLSPTVATVINALSNGLEFVNKNFDKAIMLAELLAVSLAMPAAKLGLEMAAKGMMHLIALTQSATGSVGALNIALTTGKALITGGLYVAAAASILTVIDSAMYLWEGGTKDIKDNNEAIKNSVNQIAQSYAEAYGYVQKINKESEGTGNILLDTVDKAINKINQFKDWTNSIDKKFGLDKLPGYKPQEKLETNLSVRQKQDKDLRDSSFLELQNSRGVYQKRLTDPDAITKYMKDAIALRDRIGEIQGKIAALQTQDPAGNYHQIQKLNDVLYGEKGLFTQREQLNNRFVPSGETGIEQQIKLMEMLKKEAEKANDDKQVKAINQELEVYKSNLARLQDLNKQLSSGINDQRLAWIEMTSAVVGFQRELEKTNNIKESKLIDSFTKRGITSGAELSLKTSQFDYYKQQTEVNRLKATIKSQEQYLNSKLETQSRSLVEELQGKKISQFNAKDLDSLQKKIAANSNLKNSINDQIVGEINALLENKQQLSNADVGLSKARQAILQQQQGLEDYNTNLARSIFDFNQSVRDQQIQITDSYRGYARQLEDAQINSKLKARSMVEGYQDLLFTLNSNLDTAKNGLLTTQEQIQSEKLKQQNLSISPGVDSIAKQVNSIFNQLFDSLTNGEQEKRQANLDAAQIQRQYVDTLRQIRGLEEEKITAQREQVRSIFDLKDAFVKLIESTKKLVIEQDRKRPDLIRDTKRQTGVDISNQLLPNPNYNYTKQTGNDATNYSPQSAIYNNQPVNNRVPFSVPIGQPLQSPVVPQKPVIPSFDNGSSKGIDYLNNRYGTNKPKVTQQVKIELPKTPINVTAKVVNTPPVNVKITPTNTRQVQEQLQATKIYQTSANIPNPVYVPPTDDKRTSPTMDEINRQQQPPVKLAPVQPQQPNILQQGINAIGNGLNAVSNFISPPAQAAPISTKSVTMPTQSWEKNLAGLLNRYGSQMTVEDFKRASAKSGINIDALVTQAFIESHFGTKGRGRFTKNPLNYGNDDAGNNKYFKTYGEGLEYAAIKLKKDFFFTSPEDFMARNFKGRYGRYATDPLYKPKYNSALTKMRNILYGNLRSDIPKEFKIAGGISDMGMGLFADSRIDQINKEKAKRLKNDPLQGKSLVTNWDSIMNYWKQQYPESYSPDIMSKFKDKFIDTQSQKAKNQRANQVKQWMANPKPLEIKSSPVMLKKSGITKQIKENAKQATVEGITEAVNTPIKAPVMPQVNQATVAPVQGFGIQQVNGITPVPNNLDYNTLNKLNDAQKAVNVSANEFKQILIATKQETAYLEAIDNLERLKNTLEDANIAKTRAVFDSKIELANMAQSSKGYLTAYEQNQKIGYDVWKTYEDKRRAIADANREEMRKQEKWDSQRVQLATQLNDNPNLLPQQKQILIAQINGLDVQMEQSKTLQEQYATQANILNSLNDQAIIVARIRDDEDRRFAAMKEFGDLQANLASARYNYGGQLVNEGAVISAKLNAKMSEQELKRKLETLQVTGKQRAEMLAMNKELNETNIAQSYVDAIPFLKEFSSNLKDVVLQTTNWRDALKKLLDLAASTILDQLVIKPMQNGIANILNDWGMFSGTEPIKAPSSSPNSGFTTLPVDKIKGVDLTSVLSLNGVTGDATPNMNYDINSIGLEVSKSLESISKAAPNVAYSFAEAAVNTAQNTITEQTALLAFTTALTTATNAVMMFAVSMGANPSSAFGSISSLGLSGLSGLFSNSFNAGNAAAGLSSSNLLGSFGDFVQLPFFADGYNPIDTAMKKERAASGKNPMLAVINKDEVVLSANNNDAQLWQLLKANGEWDNLKATVPNYANGNTNITPVRSQSSGGVTVIQNWNVTTKDADSFRKSQSRLDNESAARLRRTTQR